MPDFISYDVGLFKTFLTSHNVPTDIIDELVELGDPTDPTTVAMVSLVDPDIAHGPDVIKVSRSGETHKITYTASGGRPKDITINAKVPPRNDDAAFKAFKAFLTRLGYEK